MSEDSEAAVLNKHDRVFEEPIGPNLPIWILNPMRD